MKSYRYGRKDLGEGNLLEGKIPIKSQRHAVKPSDPMKKKQKKKMPRSIDSGFHMRLPIEYVDILIEKFPDDSVAIAIRKFVILKIDEEKKKEKQS
jgi:hypothetical protein